jgi:OmpA-OmpF porin, OOP family
MKVQHTVLALVLSVFLIDTTHAQFNILDRAKQKLEDRANRQIDKKIDEALDGKPQEQQESQKNKNNGTVNSKGAQSPMQSYAKYDFTPGSNVIFEDDFRKEKSDEIPSKWVIKGGTVETTKMDGKVIMGALSGRTSFSPRIDKSNYLSERFTVEFDMMYYRYNEDSYFDGWQGIGISFCAEGSCPQIGELSNPLIILNNGVTNFKTFKGTPGGGGYNKEWRHFALAVNEKSIKLYINEERVLNAPLGRGKAYNFTLTTDEVSSGTWQLFFRNFRIATGGADPYEQIELEGKFIARGINFDYNKATIRPESMGELNRIVDMMKEHEELRLEIGGHTDSDGDDASNQKLSEQRAESVRQQLVSMGIDSKQFSIKGYGEAKPAMDNDTPEGKANNRRVEFVKQ